jgi:hypothetical protein
MNKTLTLLLLAATLALAGLSAVLWRETTKQRAQLATLREQLDTTSATLEEQQALAARLQRQRDELRADVALLNAQLHHAQNAAAAARAAGPATTDAPATPAEKEKKGGLGEFFAKLMDSPEMKKMISDQQRAVVEAMYGPLFKELNLTPDQEAAFKQLLADQQAKGVELAGALLGGDKEARARALEQMKEQQRESDEQIRALLGESGYASYKEYTETMGERTAVQQFSQRLSGGPNALSDAQSRTLAQIMTEERRNATWSPGENIYTTDPNERGLQAVMSESAAQRALEQQQLANERVLARAATVLNADQLASLREFQENQLRMQRFGLEMGRRFLGGDDAAR